MILYHTIRAFVISLILLPIQLLRIVFCIPFTILWFISDFLDWIIEEYFEWGNFNVVKTYKAVKKNSNSNEFHKWTGRRRA